MPWVWLVCMGNHRRHSLSFLIASTSYIILDCYCTRQLSSTLAIKNNIWYTWDKVKGKSKTYKWVQCLWNFHPRVSLFSMQENQVLINKKIIFITSAIIIIKLSKLWIFVIIVLLKFYHLVNFHIHIYYYT